MRGSGTVVQDHRTRSWNYLWREGSKRRSKGLGHHPTKASAWRAAKPFRDALETKPKPTSNSVTVQALVEQYRQEKMPTRIDTRRSYEVWIKHYILPRWGECVLTDVQPRPVELWLDNLTLSPKSKSHVRGLLSVLWDFAQWAGHVLVQRNPMQLVRIKGSSKRTKKARSLTVEEFQKFAAELEQPFQTLALLCVCFGLRISEVLALKWSDVDWFGSSLRVERAIVCQNVDDTKTDGSRKQLSIDPELLALLKNWYGVSEFTKPEDWIFSSPVQLGRLPWSYDQIWRVYQKAAKAAGIGRLGTHSLRHTFRSWLDSIGTPLGIQQKLMRHSDIRMTMAYGDAFSADMKTASGKVTRLALGL